MSKRKRDDCDRIKHKIRRLEKKLRRKDRRTRSRFNLDDSESSFASRSPHRFPVYQGNDNMDFMELSGNEEVMLNLDPPSPESQGNKDRAEPEPDPIPSTSNTENAVPTPSIVAVAPEPVVVPSTTGDTIPPVQLVLPADPVPLADPLMTPIAEDLELDSELLDILGSDPTTGKKYGKDIQKELSLYYIQHWATIGLTKEQRKEFKEKYLTPENAKLIDPPELNAEIKAAVSDIVAKRDNAIEGKQKHMTSAITAVGEAITLILSAKERNTSLLKLLMDSARIICDCQHTDTVTRRNFLLNAVKKEIREELQNTKIDKLLFGENLAETLKTAKAINKSGVDLKPAVSVPKIQNKKSRNLNWKNPCPIRRQMGPPRMKEPVTTSTRSRPPSSSRQWQRPQQPGYNRR